jgi:copper homeostasis protein
MAVLIEACIDSVASALAAERGGAGRLELCDNLFDGGTTPRRE